MALTMKDLAEQDKRVSLIWAHFAIKALEGMQTVLKAKGRPTTITRGDLPPFLFHVYDALQTHFNIKSSSDQSRLVDDILETYNRVVKVLISSASSFVNDTTSGKTDPAWVLKGSGQVKFTAEFKAWEPTTGAGYGPFCRAAMVLHEPVHVVDNGSFDDAHVHEGDPKYATQPAAKQLHNAHSYAMFGQQMNFGWDARYGIGKRSL